MADQAANLRAMVKAARREANDAVMYREAWRPMAHDSQLHARLGKSFASQTFLIIRYGLWREMLSALMRIWDRESDAIHLSLMINQIQNESLIRELWKERLTTRSTDIAEEMLADLRSKAVATKIAFDNYNKGGKRQDYTFLRDFRHQQLAHAQTKRELTKAPADWCDQRTEDFYETTIFIVRQLLTIVESADHDLAGLAEEYGHSSKLFWASVKGERTEGHPNYVDGRP